MKTSVDQVIEILQKAASNKNRDGMKRFGIVTDTAIGVPIPFLRRMAKDIGKDHSLAVQLWRSGIHEARILSSMIDDPLKVTEPQLERLVRDFNSWDICDQVCGNLIDRTVFAPRKAKEWSCRDEEYVRRAGFALMAGLAVHNKGAKDSVFLSFFPCIIRAASDERNFVKKAVNWALRQIGKRNIHLHRKAIIVAERLVLHKRPSARWIAKDALRELRSAAVRNRVKINAK